MNILYLTVFNGNSIKRNKVNVSRVRLQRVIISHCEHFYYILLVGAL